MSERARLSATREPDRSAAPATRPQQPAIVSNGVRDEITRAGLAVPERRVPFVSPPRLSAHGRPLDGGDRALFERSYGADLGDVRLHRGPEAESIVDRFDAHALTVGEHVFFGRGAGPEERKGRRRLGHELAHVAQFRRHGASRSGDLVSTPGSTSEREAGHAASAALAGQRAPVSAAPQAAIHRDARNAGIGAVIGGGVGLLLGALGGPVGALVGLVIGGGIGALIGAGKKSGPDPFRTEVTTHGTFRVYPDNYADTLPIADYNTKGWPVKESVFTKIKAVIAAISAGTGKFTIGGDAAFKAAVLSDLGWLMTQSVGRELIDKINATGKALVILPTTNPGVNSTGYTPEPDSWLRDDKTPGPGSDTDIEYDTTVLNIYGGTEAWMNRPPAIGLAHEMIHAWTGMKGIKVPGETDGKPNVELQATGVGAYSADALTENRFRAAFGLPLRPRY